MELSDKPILVTGATGFVASHVIRLLLEKGYKVRGTVRSLANKDKNAFLYNLVPEKNENLELVEADLLKTATWPAAVAGVDYVMHVASPFPSSTPKDENELIRPAVDGTTNVLQAAIDSGVKKVVLTSSIAAVMFGNEGKVTGPDDWSVEEKCTAYPKSKTKAERAAWDLWKKSEGKIELATVNPGFILGPVYTSGGGTSEEIIRDFLKGKVPFVPKVMTALVDVRDVAECHLKAMINPNSNGKRYICVSDSLWFLQMAGILREEFGKYGYSLPKSAAGNWLIKFGGIFDKRLKSIVPELGVERRMDVSLSKDELGLIYRSPKETLVDMGNSLIKLGIVPDKISKKASK